MKEFDVAGEWPTRLRELLAAAPIVQRLTIHASQRSVGLDGEVAFVVDGQAHRLLVECKSAGQPRHVHGAVAQLRREIVKAGDLTRGLFVAPFVSPASRTLLKEADVGWLDFAGNARIVFPKFHLEIERANQDPFTSRRALRSLFYPKSARVLKVLLRPPLRLWRVAELADTAKVSAGQVSNVRRALMDRGWAEAEAREGLRLTEPGALLDAWRNDAPPQAKTPYRGYSLKPASESVLTAAFEEARQNGAGLLLASHSVARRLAPFARVAGDYFYADAKGLDILQHHLGLKGVDRGENVTVYALDDAGLLSEAVAIAPALSGTDPVQTYLDLLATGERGREAAEHWRNERIDPHLEPA